MRMLPELNADNEFYWTSGAEGVLKITRCQECSHFIHPPSPMCPKCRSRDLAPETISGTGKVASFTINMQKWHPMMEVPFVIAIVELDEQPGLNLTTNIINTDVTNVQIGMKVKVCFEHEKDVYLPMFEPLTETK